MVAEAHRLRDLHVREAGQQRRGIGLGLVEQRVAERVEQRDQLVDGVAHVEPQVGGDLVVARAAGVQLAGERADVFVQQALDERVEVTDEYLGGGYGEPTEAMLGAVALAARLEGLLVDPVYTGKTLSGLIDLARRGLFKENETVVFWHTGGTPALFAYRDTFEPLLAADVLAPNKP